MIPLITDSQVNSVALVIIAAITIVPATMAALNAKKAKDNSVQAKHDSAEARQNSADVLNEVQTNGGMTSPNPNLNDHIKHQTLLIEGISETVNSLDNRFSRHLQSHEFMDPALAELYLTVRPTINFPKEENETEL